MYLHDIQTYHLWFVYIYIYIWDHGIKDSIFTTHRVRIHPQHKDYQEGKEWKPKVHHRFVYCDYPPANSHVPKKGDNFKRKHTLKSSFLRGELLVLGRADPQNLQRDVLRRWFPPEKKSFDFGEARVRLRELAHIETRGFTPWKSQNMNKKRDGSSNKLMFRGNPFTYEFIRSILPPKTKMTIEKQACEDVSPIKNCDFPLPCSLNRGLVRLLPNRWLFWPPQFFLFALQVARLPKGQYLRSWSWDVPPWEIRVFLAEKGKPMAFS